MRLFPQEGSIGSTNTTLHGFLRSSMGWWDKTDRVYMLMWMFIYRLCMYVYKIFIKELQVKAHFIIPKSLNNMSMNLKIKKEEWENEGGQGREESYITIVCLCWDQLVHSLPHITDLYSAYISQVIYTKHTCLITEHSFTGYRALLFHMTVLIIIINLLLFI